MATVYKTEDGREFDSQYAAQSHANDLAKDNAARQATENAYISAHNNAQKLQKEENYQEAIKEWNNALLFAENHVDKRVVAFANLAGCYYKLRQYDNTIKCSENALNLDGEHNQYQGRHLLKDATIKALNEYIVNARIAKTKKQSDSPIDVIQDDEVFGLYALGKQDGTQFIALYGDGTVVYASTSHLLTSEEVKKLLRWFNKYNDASSKGTYNLKANGGIEFSTTTADGSVQVDYSGVKDNEGNLILIAIITVIALQEKSINTLEM